MCVLSLRPARRRRPSRLHSNIAKTYAAHWFVQRACIYPYSNYCKYILGTRSKIDMVCFRGRGTQRDAIRAEEWNTRNDDGLGGEGWLRMVRHVTDWNASHTKNHFTHEHYPKSGDVLSIRNRIRAFRGRFSSSCIINYTQMEGPQLAGRSRVKIASLIVSGERSGPARR